MDGTIRIKTAAWSATTAVLAVVCTLLVTQAWSAGAAPGDQDSTFVPTAGCRLVDTRANSPVGVPAGGRTLGAGDVFEVTVHGENGNCTGDLAVPVDAVAAALNVTAVNASASSNIRIYPANLAEVPTLSNLNVTAGAPPTPNKVDVKLSPDGKIKVFNFRGSVNIFIDVVGYYTSSTLQELEQRLVALETAPAPFATEFGGDQVFTVGTTPSVVRSLSILPPTDGSFTVNSTAYAVEDTANRNIWCSLTTSDTEIDFGYLQFWQSGVAEFGQMSGTRAFNVFADELFTVNLICQHNGGIATDTHQMRDSNMTGIYLPT